MTRTFLALVLAVLATGCATTQGSDPRDPWEPMNRSIFEFNDSADRALMKPLAQTYVKVVPEVARTGVHNFFENLADVGTGLNNVLQGKPGEGVSDLGRFVVNSTLGIFGLVDVASPMGLEKHSEDFGQTLGVWGVRPGPYFVIPFLGPSTARDAPARAVDPSWYYNNVIDNSTITWTLWGIEQVHTRASLLKSESLVDQAALDRYTFIRDAWLQRRRNQVYDGKPPREKEEE
jgi:phospholipid-binding lipoprotein MlaA